MAISKERIIEEMKRVAEANGGTPLGRVRFQKETGIKDYDWGRYWTRFSDVQREAGLIPNTFIAGYGEEVLFEKVVMLIRELGRYPTMNDLRLRGHNDPDFPNLKTIQRLGSKKETALKISDFAKRKGYADIIQFCKSVIEGQRNDVEEVTSTVPHIREVYLFKSGRYYKIGKTSDTVRRGAELKIQLPESLNLVHSIKTDDPSGIEAYWHRRFESKRMNGEWFDLNPSEVKAFKAWKRIV